MIVVCGEALIDLFVGPVEGAEMPARAVAGGSPFNVAIGLARLGVDVAFLGGISRDRFGALLASTLVREGVDDRFLVRTDRLSTISMVATDDNGQPSYAFPGEGAADRWLALADLPATLPPDVLALTFGSYTMAVEPVGSALAALDHCPICFSGFLLSNSSLPDAPAHPRLLQFPEIDLTFNPVSDRVSQPRHAAFLSRAPPAA